ncbi:sensor histidine kinase [Owenweeksia hongkongensis]|uniref:sensor histidine kinase n=1 Tax=Owenweeksia hongkongensis TaxID=253245 RepID=UPI003A932145
MTKKQILSKPNRWELIFQILLLVMTFVFYASERSKGQVSIQIDEPKVMFFLNYALAAYVINYWLLPKFLYLKKYLLFALLVVALIGAVIFIEEGIIEQIYYPETRGSRFPGFAFTLLTVMPIITILTGFKFAWDALTKQRQVEQLQSAVKESELQYLKSQINPHFLFNNLNNLYSYALENSPKTPDIILELSGLLRYMLYECKAKFVPLQKEVEQLGNFVNLSRLQLEERGEVEFSANLKADGFQVAPLILSVFVENAFKHSLSSISDDIKIKIALEVDENGKLIFTCVNSFSEESNTEDLSKGIGLENVRKRLNILYPDAYKLDITTDGELYAVKLIMDLKRPV